MYCFLATLFFSRCTKMRFASGQICSFLFMFWHVHFQIAEFYISAEPLRSEKKGISYKISLRASFKIVFYVCLKFFLLSLPFHYLFFKSCNRKSRFLFYWVILLVNLGKLSKNSNFYFILFFLSCEIFIFSQTSFREVIIEDFGGVDMWTVWQISLKNLEQNFITSLLAEEER